MTSKAGFSGQPSGLQKSSIKELMRLGTGDGPSVLNYSKCMGPRAGGCGGGWALLAWWSWLPPFRCLDSHGSILSPSPYFSFFGGCKEKLDACVEAPQGSRGRDEESQAHFCRNKSLGKDSWANELSGMCSATGMGWTEQGRCMELRHNGVICINAPWGL